MLPPTTKEQIRDAGEFARNREDLVCDEVFTSGTTSLPLVTIRGDREQEYIRKFYSALYNVREFSIRARGLEINNPFHGAQFYVPGPVHQHRIGIFDRGSFEHARRVLTEKHSDRDVSPVCTVIVGLERALRAFAVDTLIKYPDGLETKIQFIVPYAQYVTRRSRRLLETAFGGRVLDRYGLSEVFGGASQSEACGWYHFDPSIVAEVVSPKTLLPMREGIGILLLTALYPFQEAQPLIRYVTGDIVAVTHSRSSRPGEIAIQPLGRNRYSIPRPDGDGWIVVPAEAYEAIDETPEIRRSPLFRDAAQIEDPHAIGHPRYNLRYRDEEGLRNIVVNIEISEEHLHRAGEIVEDLKSRILNNSPTAYNWWRDGRGRFEVVATAQFPADVISYRE